MKRLLFVLLLMTCSVSWAEWELSGGDSEDNFYHDKSTIRKNGVIVKIWTMLSHANAVIENGYQYKSSKNLFVFNCKLDTSELISILKYSGSMGSGKVVFSANWQEKDWEWKPVVPGTYTELHYKIACGLK